MSSASRRLVLEYLNWHGLNFRDDAALTRQLSRVSFMFVHVHVRIHRNITGQLVSYTCHVRFYSHLALSLDILGSVHTWHVGLKRALLRLLC